MPLILPSYGFSTVRNVGLISKVLSIQVALGLFAYCFNDLIKWQRKSNKRHDEK
jgi:hypothetical protein